MDLEETGSVVMGDDPQETEELELKGDALNDGASDCVSAAGSRFSLASRASPSPRASLRSQQSLVNRRRGRSDATHSKQPMSRPREGSAGSASPAESHVSSLSLNTPARSTRSASTAAPSVDPRGDHDLLQLMDLGDPVALTSLDLSLAPKKTKKSLKSLQSLGEFINVTELNVANNAISCIEGVDAFGDLTILNLSRNHIKRIDSPLFTLVQLRSLDLSGNFISHIPRGVAALEVLEVFNVSGNNLSALKEIDVLGKLVNLHTCNLSANPFCKLPTYKDYAISKLLSLERLDDCLITDQLRDKSRRRFSDEMFSKDKCIREAGIAHASEQTKLREMQLALEAENSKLKDELQLKSKLLQNKSRAWSSATEQLLQLQHDLAMMNLDRRQGSEAIEDFESASERTSTRGDPTSNQPDQDPQVQTAIDHPTRPTIHTPAPQNSKALNPGLHNLKDVRQVSCATSPLGEHGRASKNDFRSPPSTSVVDAACSPFLEPESRRRVSCANESEMFAQHSPQFKQRVGDHNARADKLHPGMLSPCDYASHTRHDARQDTAQQHASEDNEVCDEDFQSRPSLRVPTYEDDSGCPAYDDPSYTTSPECCGDPNLLRVAQQHASLDARPSTTEQLSPLRSPQSHMMWERQRARFVQETSRDSPKKASKRSQVMGLVEKENLVRQIQALQSCKQSYLAEIAKEEQLLHELKRESSSYANHIERLESDLQVLIGASTRCGRTGTASQQREEETIRAKLEMLRNKLHYAEDKEGEIEATIVRMTKRVLEEDIQHAKDYGRSFSTHQGGHGAFDKEIFALTHNLQLVIVEKEEIHSEMSRLMNQLRTGSNDGNSIPQSTGLSAEVLLLMDQHEQLQRVSAENQSVFIDKQRKVDEYKRKLRDVHDRITVKEDLLASLVTELKDVESELAYINEIAPPTPRGHRRSLSLDSLPSSSGDQLERATANSCTTSPRNSGLPDESNKSKSPRKAAPSPRKQSHLEGSNRDTHESISSMVEAAAADMNSQFEQKFKELFSPDVLESIKKDIYEKLSRQLPSSTSKSRVELDEQRVGLHAAIAAALDTHMKKAMESFEKQRDELGMQESGKPPPSPRKQNSKGNTAVSQAVHPDVSIDTASDRENERKCWDEVDDFMPIAEASYITRYKYVKEMAVSALSPTANGKCLRTASAQRIQKACERLEQAEMECRVDTFSGIEIDNGGRKKSDLKVVIMGARDLPTSHLRTKNLDPYVALEIVYPQHVRPQATTTTLRLSSSTTSSHNRHTFTDEPTQLPNQSFRSRTVKKSVYPVWDEEFDFAPVHSLKGYLHVRVLNDRKLSREQLVGEIKIPLRMLVDQKKMIESFVLNTSTSDPKHINSRRLSSTPRIASNGSSGTIRIQLQLSFSRIEKFKRAVDELVTKYVDEHNQLPPFIERIEQYESRLAASTRGSNPENDHIEADDVGTNVGTQPLPSFESWKAQQSETVSNESRVSGSDIQDPQSPTTKEVPRKAFTSEASIGTINHTTGLSAARSASLWSNPSKSHSTEPLSSKSNSSDALTSTNKKDDVLRSGSIVRPSKPSTAASQGMKKANAPASASAKAAMAQLRQMVNANKPTQATTSLPNAGAGFSILNNSSGNRRKTVNSTMPASTSSMSPDCFDDYSPYHPDFQLLDPLGIDSMGMSGTNMGPHNTHGKPRSTSYSSSLARRGSGDDRRTDLRIFKSPGFSRREPSGGFPERFIGLDTQTSERIKRIFGRIDSQG